MTLDIPNDLIHRFLFDESDVRGEIVTLKHSFQDAVESQNLPADILPLFGQFLAAASMLSDVLKFDGILTLQARGDGPVPIIMAEANNKGDLRGVVNVVAPDSLLTDDTNQLKTLSELLGKGVLTLTLDPKNGQRYQGIVPLDGADLGECIEHYFEQSEQIPTQVVLFSDAERCGGIFLQCLPAQKLPDPGQRQELWETTMQLAGTIKTEEFFALDHATILFRLFNELSCRIFEPKTLQFKCSCSKARSARALHALDKDELVALLQEQQSIALDCQFCGTQYSYDTDDINAVLQDQKTMH